MPHVTEVHVCRDRPEIPAYPNRALRPGAIANDTPVAAGWQPGMHAGAIREPDGSPIVTFGAS